MSAPALTSELTAYPLLQPFAPATEAGDWARVYAAYSALESDDWRSGAIGEVSDVDGVETMLAEVANRPGDGTEQLVARTMLASTYIRIGWNIRSGLRAKYVSDDQFLQFHDYLRRAERLLIDVVARQPDNEQAWRQRLISARGLQLGQSEARRRYDHATRNNPHFSPAQVQLLQQLCPKWSGTLDRMHAFARECADAAPPGSINPVLIVQAHLEQWGDLKSDEGQDYLTSPTVRASVDAAADKSVLHPDYLPGYGWVSAHAYFALYFCVVQNWPAAARHFQALGDLDASGIWGYFYGRAEEKFLEHRARALAKG